MSGPKNLEISRIESLRLLDIHAFSRGHNGGSGMIKSGAYILTHNLSHALPVFWRLIVTLLKF